MSRRVHHLVVVAVLAALVGASLCGGCRRQRVTAATPALTDAPARFRDVTREAGLQFRHFTGATGRKYLPETMGAGAACFDADGDGDTDILLLNGMPWPGDSTAETPTSRLFLNNGQGRFTDRTAASGLDIPLYGMGAAAGDYDADGRTDIYVTTALGPNRLFRNEGGGRFRDVTATAGVGAREWGTSCAWTDYDRDGRLDLIVANYIKWTPETDLPCTSGLGERSYCRPNEYGGEPARLYHNEGGGKFRDVTREAGLESEIGKGLGVCVTDLDRDGFPDLVIANDTERNFAFRNDGQGRFQEVGQELGLAFGPSGQARSGMGIDTALLGEGNERVVAVGNFTSEGIGYFAGEATRGFEDIAARAGVMQPSLPLVTFATLFLDANLDGYQDLFAVSGHIQDQVAAVNPEDSHRQKVLLFQGGASGYREIAREAGFTELLVGRGAAVLDYDQDGRPDLLVTENGGPARLYRNETPRSGHWLTLALRGTRSNRDGYGAVVTVRAGGRAQVLECRSGAGYLCASENRLFVGLGAAGAAERVEVQWPSGQRDVIENLAADRGYTITEGSGAAQP